MQAHTPALPAHTAHIGATLSSCGLISTGGGWGTVMLLSFLPVLLLLEADAVQRQRRNACACWCFCGVRGAAGAKCRVPPLQGAASSRRLLCARQRCMDRSIGCFLWHGGRRRYSPVGGASTKRRHAAHAAQTVEQSL